MTAFPIDAEAAHLASQADIWFREGKAAEAMDLYARAAELTETAVAGAQGPRSLSLLMGNAVMLWWKARRLDRAESLAHRYLLQNPPPGLASRLKQALFACWQEETLGQDEYFTAFEVALSGPDVGFGVAPSDEVASREEGAQALLWRAAEHEAGLPLRARGLPPPGIQKVAQLYSAVPLPGSFKLSFKVRASMTQTDWLADNNAPPELRTKGGEPLVHRPVSLVQVIAGGSDSDLSQVVPDPKYRVTFMKLVRDLAPDGRRLDKVDIGGGKTLWRSASLTRHTRERVQTSIESTFHQAGWATANGRLTGMQLQKTDLKVTLECDGGSKLEWIAPLKSGFEEKIGPLWGRRVLLAGQKEQTLGNRTRYCLEHIEDEADITR